MKLKGSFVDQASFMLEDGFKSITARLLGIPFKSKIPFMHTGWLEYIVLEDFTYNHNDQDVANGVYNFKRGQKISLRSDTDPMYFMPDRSKLILNRVYTKGHKFEA